MTLANPVSSTQRVSGELGISQSSVVCHLHDLDKSSQNYWIELHITKILQDFWLILVHAQYFKKIYIENDKILWNQLKRKFRGMFQIQDTVSNLDMSLEFHNPQKPQENSQLGFILIFRYWRNRNALTRIGWFTNQWRVEAEI